MPTLDTSNFPPTGHSLSSLYSTDNALDLFYFKSEVGADRILSFIGLKAKCYTMIKQSYEGGEPINEIISKLKGINTGAVGELGFVSYLITLLYGVKLNATFTKLSSKGHLITMEKICKQALSNFDDKIRIQSCGIHIKKYGQEIPSEVYTDYCNCQSIYNKIVDKLHY